MTHDFIFWFVSCNDGNCVNAQQSNATVNWPTSISIGTSVFFCQVSICLRDSTWLLTEHATVALQDLTAVGPPPAKGWRWWRWEWDCIRDWHVMDAGPSNSIHLFIYLPGLSCLSASTLGERRADWMSARPGELTDSDLTWFKELVNLYDVKAGGLLVYCMLMYDKPVV